MGGKKAVDPKEYGLEFSLILNNYLLNSEHLHYGLWDQGYQATLANLPRAQERYAEALIETIPAGVQRILDVGCGSGALPARLLEKGYEVDCVSPSDVLTRHARDKLGDRATIHHAKFEDLEPSPDYDLVLFSESFQYIPMETALELARGHLREGGRILICDFFKAGPKKHAPLGWGHRYSMFPDACEATNLQVEWEQDITDETAPTLDVFDEFIACFLKPTWELSGSLLSRRFPWLSRIGRKLLNKPLTKMEQKHLSRRRDGDYFRRTCTYRRICLVPEGTTG
jgi:SAM-dependent methyltransferase